MGTTDLIELAYFRQHGAKGGAIGGGRLRANAVRNWGAVDPYTQTVRAIAALQQ